MIKTFLTLTALFGLMGGCLTSSQPTQQPAPPPQASQQGKVVYAVRNISRTGEGEIQYEAKYVRAGREILLQLTGEAHVPFHVRDPIGAD
jgi:hypothetical protein